MGFWTTIAFIASPAYFGYFTMYMMLRWQTAIIELALVAVISYVAVKRHEKYHRAEKYNDQNWKPKDEGSAWR